MWEKQNLGYQNYISVMNYLKETSALMFSFFVVFLFFESKDLQKNI